MPRPRWPLAIALAANAAAAGALIHATRAAIGGPFVFALDDAYIHLGVARTLAETGTWGVNPGEFASASSSPLWTLLLAATRLLTPALPEVALAWNAAAGALLCWLVDRWLVDTGFGPPGRLAGLLAVSAAVPLPFLGCLGMEHVLHLLLVLSLLRAADPADTPVRDPRRLVAVGALAGAACLTRYESLFVVAAIALGGPREGRRAAIAALLGGVGAVTAFGVWSVAQGGLPLPHALYTKALLDRDWIAGLRSAVHDGAGVVALAVAVGIGGAVSADPRARRRSFVFGAVALTHVLLARVGWLYRYEAWLVGWGVLQLVTVAPRLGRAAAPALLALSLPLAVRTADAVATLPVGARLQADVNLSIARWITHEWPDATLAVHDLGALAWGTRARLVDLAGLGTTAVTRLQLAGRLDNRALDGLVAARGVQFAVTGRTWRGGALPSRFEEVARVWAPFPAGPGEFETVIWSVDPTLHDPLVASLDTLSDTLPARARLERADERVIPLSSLQLTGAAVIVEADGVAFYTNGEATFTAPASGTLRLTADGSFADGRGPRFEVGELSFDAGPARTVFVAGSVRAGDTVRVRFADDAEDTAGNDRNLYLRRLTILP